MMAWEAKEKGYTCNDCYLSMQNCHDKSICCEDETGLCDWFEEIEAEEIQGCSDDGCPIFFGDPSDEPAEGVEE